MQHSAEKKRSFSFLILPTLFIILMWLIFGVEYVFDLDFAKYSIEPRTINGLVGVLLFPLLHGSLEHIAGNTVSLFMLLLGARYIFPNLFLRIFAISYLVPGIFTWLVARPSYHLGASGMIYALVVFLFVSGVIRVNRYLLALSLLVVFLYGSLFWGIFPIEPGISWEGHLGGALTGFFLAVWYRNEEPADEIREKEHIWDDEEPDFDDWKEANSTESNQSQIVYHYKPNRHTNETKDY